MTFEIARSVRAACSGRDVIGLVTDPATWAQWQPEVTSSAGPSPLAAGDVATGTATMLGFRVHGHATSVEVSPDRYVQDVIVGIRMRIRYEVSPDERGTIVTHRLACDLPRGPMGRLLSLFLRGRLRWMQRRALAGVAAMAERRRQD